MTTKEQVINELIEEHGYKSYLEIGFANGDSFHKVNCETKVAVDPAIKASHVFKMTSDEFFETIDDKFDIIFIDGLHHADQVRKDINNASKHLSPNGVIVLHDVNPTTKAMQQVPRAQREWTGDCWRAMVGFIEKYPDVEAFTYPSDYGVGVIKPNGKKFRAYFENMDITYEEFNKNRFTLLKCV